MDLVGDKACDIVVVLTDADANPWLEVRKRESARIPEDYRHLTVFGVADRNRVRLFFVDGFFAYS